MLDPMGRLGMRILLRGWLLSSEILFVCLFLLFWNVTNFFIVCFVCYGDVLCGGDSVEVFNLYAFVVCWFLDQ